MRVSRQLTYLVLKDFRFAGRNFKAGDEFLARRLRPQMHRLRRMVKDGLLGLPGEDPEPQPEPEAEEPDQVSEEQPEVEEAPEDEESEEA